MSEHVVTVKELKERLAQLPDDSPVEFAIRTYTKAGISLYVPFVVSDAMGIKESVVKAWDNHIRFDFMLPDNISIMTRKAK